MKTLEETNMALNAIQRIDDFNSREGLGDIDALAREIKRDGLLNPLTVALTDDGQSYRLISGFRRYEALTQIGADMVPVRIIDVKDEKEALIVNAAENIFRKSLSTYEKALVALKLSEQGMSGGQIASRLRTTDGDTTAGFSKGNVNAYIHALKNLEPRILKAWKEQDPRLQMAWMYKISKFDKDEQLKLWDIECGVVEPESEPESEPSEDNPSPEPSVKKASGKNLEAALVALEEADLTPAILNAARSALKFALGHSESFKISRKVIFDPNA